LRNIVSSVLVSVISERLLCVAAWPCHSSQALDSSCCEVLGSTSHVYVYVCYQGANCHVCVIGRGCVALLGVVVVVVLCATHTSSASAGVA
jgi:hypothetical protein